MANKKKNSINKKSNKTQPKTATTETEIFICFCSARVQYGIFFCFSFFLSFTSFFLYIFGRHRRKLNVYFIQIITTKHFELRFFFLLSRSQRKQYWAKNCILRWPCRWKIVDFISTWWRLSRYWFWDESHWEVHSHKRFGTIIASPSSSSSSWAAFFENDSFHSSRSLICERGERLMRSRHTWWIDYFTVFFFPPFSLIRLFNLLHDNIYQIFYYFREEFFSWIIH